MLGDAPLNHPTLAHPNATLASPPPLAGKYTFFGKAADMINSVEAVGRFQKIVFGITMWLLAASIFLTIVIFVRVHQLIVDSASAPFAWPGSHKWPAQHVHQHLLGA